jgi:hypothetical protein
MYAIVRDLELDYSRRQELVQQIRLSRASLGAVLEWLESSDVNPELVGQLQTYIDHVSAEVDELVDALAVLLRRGSS